MIFSELAIWTKSQTKEGGVSRGEAVYSHRARLFLTVYVGVIYAPQG